MSEGEDVRVELRGLSTPCRIGVTEPERQETRRIVFDISFAVTGATATSSDEIEGTVDYGAVASLAEGVARGRSFKTLERLCAAVADAITAEHEVAELEIRAAKPDPPMPGVIDEVAVTLRR